MGLDFQRQISSKFTGHRLRRYAPCAAFIIAITFFQFYAISIKNSHFIKNTINSLANLRNPKNRSAGPIHVLLVSYARTGSSFVGDVLQSLPNTFYYFEPLHYLSNSVLNDSFDEARTLLSKLYTCNVSSVQGFLPWQRKHKTYMKLKRSLKYWKICSKINTCYNNTFIDSYCKNHRIVIAKTIRLKLKDAANLFVENSNLNLKIIYLSRDPRGTINSRRKFPIAAWCKKDPMCSNTNMFCSALDEDVETICTLSKERPDDFMVLRYEDLSIDTQTVANHLTQFLGFSSIPEEMEAFLHSHTAVVGDIKQKAKTQGVEVPYSTFRNSSITATTWRQQLSFQQMFHIQKKCQDVLTALGYYSYSTLASMRSNVNFDLNVDNAIGSFCSGKS